MTPADLLDHAERLIAPPPNRPRQVDLRRAISAAYYALFHQLSGDAAELYASAPATAAALRRLVEHAGLQHAAQRFRGGTVPAALAAVCTPSPELRRVATDVTALQSLRHAADYDLARTFDKPTAVAAIESARATLTLWDGLRSTDEGRLFLGSATRWKAWDRPPR